MPLMKCLVQREELKCKIQKLILEECKHLSADDVSELEEIVNVEWDEAEYRRRESFRFWNF
ncbi:hypothetical protein BT96DRAFT_1021423 [Gymnopus androsaceus JB14]|uniref:Uncharacterized protein n=1 Tax=Gymnopus androsaceus JB14 TaxID=1447944 RepID=A0A6A4HGL1_9AGAR|nr:hypothetical protein BT96DRAFT_1021423 [Gymnopus androsaceus JB14]